MNNLVEVAVPMPSGAAAERAQAALDAAQALVIATPEQYTAASTELMGIKGKWKEIDEARKTLVKPIDEARKRIQEFFAGPLDFLARAEGIVKGKLVDYSREQQRIREEEQRKADEVARREREKQEAAAAEARRKAEEEAAALRRKAEEEAAAGRAAEAAKLQAKAAQKIERGEAKAEGLEQRAATVVAPVIHREVPKVAGISMREVPKFEIVNETLIPREYLAVDEKKIRAVVNALKLQANIPGVRVWMEKQPAAAAATG